MQLNSESSNEMHNHNCNIMQNISINSEQYVDGVNVRDLVFRTVFRNRLKLFKFVILNK